MPVAMGATPDSARAHAARCRRSRLEAIGEDEIGSRPERSNDRRQSWQGVSCFGSRPRWMCQLSNCGRRIRGVPGLQSIRWRVNTIIFAMPILIRIGIRVDLRTVRGCNTRRGTRRARLIQRRIVVRHHRAEMVTRLEGRLRSPMSEGPRARGLV